MNIFIVALGGAFGAVCRYGLSQLPVESSFPIATFFTNLIGAFLIGFISGVSEKKGVSKEMVLFIKTGFCGGFTTFSTFSLETVTLLEQGKYGIGTVYMALSLVCCLAGVVLGQICAKKCWK